MNIKFDPNNVVIKLCMMGMKLEDSGNIEDAVTMFHNAWHEATDDYESFIAAYHLARLQKNITEKLEWLKTSLQCAQNIDDDNVKSAYTTLYINIAKCYEELDDSVQATRNYELAKSYNGTLTDEGPFYHGTKSDLKVGDFLTAGGNSNYKYRKYISNFINVMEERG